MRRVLAVALMLAALPASAATFYFSPTGSGSTCSAGSPCHPTQLGSMNWEPTDTMIFATGTYKTATANTTGLIAGSDTDDGASGQPVTFQPDTGATPILTCLSSTALDDSTFVACDAAADCDGNSVADTAFARVYKVALSTTVQAVYETATPVATVTVDDRAIASGGNCYSACTGSRFTFDVSMPYTLVSGTQATNVDTISKLPGSWWQGGTPTTLYVHLWDSGDPTTAGRDLEVAITPRAFRLTDVDFVTVDGFTIRYCPAGIEDSFATGVTITDNDVQGGGHALSTDGSGISVSTAGANIAIERNIVRNVMRRGDCEANGDACSTGLAALTSKHDGWTGGISNSCFSVDSDSATATTGVTFRDNVGENCNNSSQLMGLDGPIIERNLLSNCINHAMTVRAAVTDGACTGYVIRENVFHDCQELGPYVSSCNNGKMIRNGGLSIFNSLLNEYNSTSSGWRLCGNLFTDGNVAYVETIRTNGTTPVVSDVNWLPGTATCYYASTAYSCDPLAGAANDWQEVSGQDANSVFTGFSLAGVTYPLTNHGTGDYQRSAYLPVSGSTAIRDKLTDLDCDGDVDGADACDAGNHCYGGAADIGPFEWGIDVPDASARRRIIVTGD